MSTLAGVKVGDEVMVSAYGRQAKPEAVTMVGRKLLTVSSGLKFRIEDGSLNSGYTGVAHTHADYEAMRRRGALVQELRDLGVDIYRANLSTEQIEAILGVVR